MSVTQLRRDHSRRHEIAGEIVQHLTAFESDLDRVLSSGARLLAMLPDARAQANLSRGVGQEAIANLSNSVARIGEAMTAAAVGHRDLEQLRQALRLTITAAGDKPEHPDVFRGA